MNVEPFFLCVATQSREFRSVNPTAFHSYPVSVHVLRFLVAIRLALRKNLCRSRGGLLSLHS